MSTFLRSREIILTQHPALSAAGISEASAELPDGSKQTNGQPGNGGKFGYRGPCAPPGPSHHYTCELFAIDQKLGLPPTATRVDVTKAIDGHIVGHAMLVTLFHH